MEIKYIWFWNDFTIDFDFQYKDKNFNWKIKIDDDLEMEDEEIEIQEILGIRFNCLGVENCFTLFWKQYKTQEIYKILKINQEKIDKAIEQKNFIKLSNLYIDISWKVFYQSWWFWFYELLETTIDPKSFEILKYFYCKDKNWFYFENKKIETNWNLEELSSFYAKDDLNLFYNWEVVEWIDLKTLKTSEEFFIDYEDKNFKIKYWIKTKKTFLEKWFNN